MRLTDKDKIKELINLKKHNVLLTDNDNKELKLGQLEDIEEELGIDLITLFKALKNGVYYCNTQLKINYAKNIRLSFAYKTLVADRHIYKYLCDYGKTWALNKKDLTEE